MMKRTILLILAAAVIAVGLSAGWGVAYIFTFTGTAVLVLVGHLVTIDDDLPGGWSNPDRAAPFPWRELVTKAAIVVLLLVLIVAFPALQQFGAHP